jgi:hypothetical protein
MTTQENEKCEACSAWEQETGYGKVCGHTPANEKGENCQICGSYSCYGKPCIEESTNTPPANEWREENDETKQIEIDGTIYP